jgi:predicted pyridoxine 5'-phosphate oxidase superfamily flavin-nucleotide-binding protein
MLLTEDMKQTISRLRLCYVATVCPDGKPNLSPKGTIRVLDDQHIGFADIASPGTVENLRHNPFVEINAVDPVLRKGYRFKGTAEVSSDPEMLCLVGSDLGFAYPVRHAIVILVQEAYPVLSPAYTVAKMSEEQIRATFLAHYGYCCRA